MLRDVGRSNKTTKNFYYRKEFHKSNGNFDTMGELTEKSVKSTSGGWGFQMFIKIDVFGVSFEAVSSFLSLYI